MKENTSINGNTNSLNFSQKIETYIVAADLKTPWS